MFRLLGVLAGLATITDLGTGAPLEESLRRAVVAVRLARLMGCSPEDTGSVLHTSLLMHLGCSAYAHETAAVWGDEVAFLRLAFLTDFADRRDVWRTWVQGLADVTGRPKRRVVATALTSGRAGGREAPVATCETARDAARRLKLSPAVQTNLFHAVTMWNGKGYPPVGRDEIPLATRVMQVAATAVMFIRHAGPEVAAAQIRRRAGTSLDPQLTDLYLRNEKQLTGDLDEIDPYDALLALEPDPVRVVAPEDLDEMARTFGDLADLKSPWLLGHSTGVAELATEAATQLGLADVDAVRVAGHLHDLGRVAVSSGIWDKPGALTAAERDQARLHPHHGERVLSRVPELATVATLVGRHHERLDGSGYHRGVGASHLSMPARVLAAADAYRCLIEDRPHRKGVDRDTAAQRLTREVREGGLDGDAVMAVLSAAGLRNTVRRGAAAGLTQRQLEVLRLVAGGLSNREVAEQLVISRRTAEHHVQDVYGRIGVSTRAGAALFAMEHGLL